MGYTKLLLLIFFFSAFFDGSVEGRVVAHRHGHHYRLKPRKETVIVPPVAKPPAPIDKGSPSSPPPMAISPPPNTTFPPPPIPPTNNSNSNISPPPPSAIPAPSPVPTNNSNSNIPPPPPSAIPAPSPVPAIPAPAPAPTPAPAIPAPVPAPAPVPVPASASTANSSKYDVRSFGAIGDGVTDDTEAFKSAWDSACNDGAVTLLAPDGYTFMIRSTIFTGPCQSGVVFQVDGNLVAPDGPDAWPQNNSKRQWLVFYRADGMTLRGGGLIDGRGEKWWNLPCKPHRGINGTTLAGPCDSPVALRFFMSSNLTVHGLRIRNSPQFHFRFDNCRNVAIDSISINSPALSPNTDGIHVENSNNVAIYNSVIANGDDCISIGAGTLNVDIQNVTCGPSHGISIGSLGKQKSRACVMNITVRNAIIKHSDNGVRIKTWQGGSGSVSYITFDNIHMDTVRNPIIIDQYYCLSSGCANQTSAVYVSDVTYSNIKGTYDVRSPPIHFGCSDSVPCTNITVTELELLPAQGNVISNPFCWNVYGDSQTLTIPPVLSCLQGGLPHSIMDTDTDKCY